MISSDFPCTYFYSAPKGCELFYLKKMIQTHSVLFITENEQQREISSNFFQENDLPVVSFPAWNCLPYDRMSPSHDILSQRAQILRFLSTPLKTNTLILASLSTLIQKTPPPLFFKQSSLCLKIRQTVDTEELKNFLMHTGYQKTDIVSQVGEYAVRGSIIDIYPPHASLPIRLDFFDTHLQNMKSFDPISQGSVDSLQEIFLYIADELILSKTALARFQKNFHTLFGVTGKNIPLYEKVTQKIRYNGIEHWLPLFHETMHSFFDYLPPTASIVLPQNWDTAHQDHCHTIEDHFKNRQLEKTYYPLDPHHLYLTQNEFFENLQSYPCFIPLPFAPPPHYTPPEFMIDQEALPISSFYKKNNLISSFKDFKTFYENHPTDTFVFFCSSLGSEKRLHLLLNEYVSLSCQSLQTLFPFPTKAQNEQTYSFICSLKNSFQLLKQKIIFISDTFLLGQKFLSSSSHKTLQKTLDTLNTLSLGERVVHKEHGIGAYFGIETLYIENIPHDFFLLHYLNDDKLYIPVENSDLLKRYSHEENQHVPLTKLGSPSWKIRKGKLEKNIFAMAEQLMNTSAQRALSHFESITPPEKYYNDFCNRFPYVETEDQFKAIEDTLNDLASGVPMDRLICGDVGFGKTEVALRASFIMAMAGYQVAIIAPTTLLARQHYMTFTKRLKDFPLTLTLLSRLVSAKDIKLRHEDIAKGEINIIIGTHALLAPSLRFNNLGLLIIDEEQSFGVKHKEHLKNLKENIHILMLTATPIPRTLQLSLSGLKSFSLISTPPMDRLSIHTHIVVYDDLILREALQREYNRGGQIFYVAPRLKDLDFLAKRLETLVPHMTYAIAHGKVPPHALETIMLDFSDHHYDILLSTNIIESGIDLPSVNTIIIHRANMFSLSQLYQLRGRIGRSKIRGYAYLTLEPNKKITPSAEKRLSVLEKLTTLGSGFSLANYDLDIRGAGNLLGQEQSGQIHEVGIELYQEMLASAIENLHTKKTDERPTCDIPWSPQINIKIPVLIPQSYLPDGNMRLSVYRHIAQLSSKTDIESYAAETIDRYGTLPQETQNLFDIIHLKTLCKTANIEKVDVGPKGIVIFFKEDTFPYPEKLIKFLQNPLNQGRVRPDKKLFFQRNWKSEEHQMLHLKYLLSHLAEFADCLPIS